MVEGGENRNYNFPNLLIDNDTMRIRQKLSSKNTSNKIDEKVSEEEKQLSKWLNKSEEELKVEFGKPNKVAFKDNSRNRFYVYTKEKLKIKYGKHGYYIICLLYTSPSPRDQRGSGMPSSA